jgi:hypothetical protein
MRLESKDTQQEAQGAPYLSPRQQWMHSAQQVEAEDLWCGQAPLRTPRGVLVSNPAYQTHAAPDGPGKASTPPGAVGHGTSGAAIDAAAGPALKDADMDTLGSFWTQGVQPPLAAQKFALSPTSKSLSSPITDGISHEVRLQYWEADG